MTIPAELLGPSGLLVGLLLLVVVGGRAWQRGWLRPGRDLDDLKAGYEQRLADTKADAERRLAEARADYEQRLTETRGEVEWWRSTALQALGFGETLAARQAARHPNLTEGTDEQPPA